jgi:HlyD family secretion protein
MDTRLFRKASIERLSSPEELDLLLKTSGRGTWASLLAVLLLCSAASLWAFKGRISTTAAGNGMIVRVGGVINIVAPGTGTVRSIEVAVGQHVRANQVVATVAQPGLNEKVRALKDTLAELTRKRERDLKLKSDEVQMGVAALARQRANTEREITEIEQQVAFADEETRGTKVLFGQGLVTNQQVQTAAQKAVDLRAQIEDRKARLKQLDAQDFELQSQIRALDSDLQFQVVSKQRELEAANTELGRLERVASPYSGDILEIKVSAGGSIVTDGPVMSIQPDSDNVEALAYVSALQAKDIRTGMDARVSPSTVKREEYGFIRGHVVFVADYPATSAALMRNFQNEQVAQVMAGSGPVTEVRVALERDAKTESGFVWSSPGGPPVRISAGTLTVTEIVTQNRAPIVLLMPLLREKLGLR